MPKVIFGDFMKKSITLATQADDSPVYTGGVDVAVVMVGTSAKGRCFKHTRA